VKERRLNKIFTFRESKEWDIEVCYARDKKDENMIIEMID